MIPKGWCDTTAVSTGRTMKRSYYAISAMVAILLPSVGQAQDVAEFYRGRTVSLIAGFNPGGGADTYAPLVARHLGKHVPGPPNVVVRNTQGAGSVIAANPDYHTAPHED